MTTPLQVGLPEHFAARVLRIFGSDPTTDLGSLLRSTEATMEEIAVVIVRDCFEGRWRGRMSAETASRIKCEFENLIRPQEGTPPDPLAAMSEGFAEITSSSEVAASMKPTEIRGAGPGVRVGYVEDEKPPEPSVVIEGGNKINRFGGGGS
jgi:hypothetical protein